MKFFFLNEDILFKHFFNMSLLVCSVFTKQKKGTIDIRFEGDMNVFCNLFIITFIVKLVNFTISHKQFFYRTKN